MAEPTIDELQNYLKDLQSLRGRGVRTSRFGDDEVTFKSDAELKAAMVDIQDKIDRLNGVPRTTTVVVRSTKGW